MSLRKIQIKNFRKIWISFYGEEETHYDMAEPTSFLSTGALSQRTIWYIVNFWQNKEVQREPPQSEWKLHFDTENWHTICQGTEDSSSPQKHRRGGELFMGELWAKAASAFKVGGLYIKRHFQAFLRQNGLKHPLQCNPQDLRESIQKPLMKEGQQFNAILHFYSTSYF